jgi:ABC-type multidrug transport system fused ATPase/permease subunit
MNYVIKQIVLAALSVLLPFFLKWFTGLFPSFPWSADSVYQMVMTLVQWIFTLLGGSFLGKAYFTSGRRLLASDSTYAIVNSGQSVVTRENLEKFKK